MAVKVLPLEIGHDVTFAKRFARDAKALGRLNDGLVFLRLINGLYWLVWTTLLAGLQWGYLSDAKW